MNTTNILIVDDTSEHLYNAGNILQPLGYPIRVALTGHRALELIEDQKPTVILLDIMLEDMNGFQICQQLKATPNYADIAVIFVTGVNDSEAIQEGFLLGGQDYVTKPYRSSELIARVQNQVQLATQAAELKYAYHELDQFAQNVSHDLKSPLLIIEQLVTMLTDTVADSDNHDIQTITSMLNAKCQSTLTMVERLLELAHISQMPLVEKEVSLPTLFQNVSSELILLEPARNFDISVDDSIPHLLIDEDLIRIMIQNILSNAIKFTRNCNTSIITVTGELKNTALIIRIKDNGVGFDPAHADKLFQVFSRLHSSAEFEGSGVGLTIIARIMKIHGGTVSITGLPNQGATITLHFPLQRIIFSK